MKKLLVIMLLGSLFMTSCFNRRHGRTGWTKEQSKQTEIVKPS
jgi:hypothetical protein